jgi:acetyltransferase
VVLKLEKRMSDASNSKGDQGFTVTIRTISAQDFELERQFIASLSPTTGYRRLFSPRKPSDDEIRRFTSIDPSKEFALIAITGDGDHQRMIGVGRWIKPSAEANVAEFALVVADDWQGKGLGTRILKGLLSEAKRRGLEQVRGETLSENQPMLELCRKLGFSFAKVPGFAAVTQLRVELKSWPPERGSEIL